MSEWISVEDRLPESAPEFGLPPIKYWVLLSPDNATKIKLPRLGFFMHGKFYNTLATTSVRKDSSFIRQPAHWMPLPEPPQ